MGSHKSTPRMRWPPRQASWWIRTRARLTGDDHQGSPASRVRTRARLGKDDHYCSPAWRVRTRARLEGDDHQGRPAWRVRTRARLAGDDHQGSPASRFRTRAAELQYIRRYEKQWIRRCRGSAETSAYATRLAFNFRFVSCSPRLCSQNGQNVNYISWRTVCLSLTTIWQCQRQKPNLASKRTTATSVCPNAAQWTLAQNVNLAVL